MNPTKDLHIERHLVSSIALRDVILGLSDGLTVPFALAAGLSAAVTSNSLILTAGIAEVVAGAISMGLGGYLAGKTEIEHYHGERKREHREVEEIPEVEKQEVRDAFLEYGISNATKDLFVEELSQNKDKWVDFMMKFELGLNHPDPSQGAKSALRIGGAYAVAGLFPLSAYIFTKSPTQGLVYSSIITCLALATFGYLKSKMTGQPAVPGAIRMTLTGAIAASAAYLIASRVHL